MQIRVKITKRGHALCVRKAMKSLETEAGYFFPFLTTSLTGKSLPMLITTNKINEGTENGA